MQVQIHRGTRIVQAWGLFTASPSDEEIEIVEITDDEVPRLSELGVKRLEIDGTITVTPPDPPPPPPPSPDYGDDASVADQLVSAVAALRNYLATSTPTGAQTTVALKLLIRVVLFLLRGSFDPRRRP